MSARVLLATGLALLALSAPTARACNITADVDHAVRMAQSEPKRSALTVKQTTKPAKAPSTERSSSRLAGYPR